MFTLCIYIYFCVYIYIFLCNTFFGRAHTLLMCVCFFFFSSFLENYHIFGQLIAICINLVLLNAIVKKWLLFTVNNSNFTKRSCYFYRYFLFFSFSCIFEIILKTTSYDIFLAACFLRDLFNRV